MGGGDGVDRWNIGVMDMLEMDDEMEVDRDGYALVVRV